MSYVLLFLLFFLPFVVVPFGNSQFELPKIIIAIIGINLLIVLFLFSKRKKIEKIFDKKQIILVSIISVISIINLFISFSPITMFGNEFRWQGTFLLLTLLAFSLISSVVTYKKVPALLFGLLLLVTLLSSFFVGNTEGRAISTIGEPNALAAFAVFLWPFFVVNGEFKKRKIIYWILGIIFAFSIVLLSGSRSGLIAFVLQLLFCCLHFVIKIPIKKSVIISLIFLVLTFAFPFFENNEYENRGEIWIAALTAGFENPLFGGGFGNMETIIHNESLKLNNKEVGYVVDSAHNIFLDFFVQGGIISLISLVLIVKFAFENLANKKRILEIIVLIGLVAALSFNPASVVGLLGFWWVIGMGFSNSF